LDFLGLDRGIGGQMAEKSRVNMTHHRSKLLPRMGFVSGCCLRGQQLSLILPGRVYVGRETIAKRISHGCA